MIPARHEAEDVVATVFLELWRRRVKVRLVDGSILPWLLVTTTNVARNTRRAAFRYRKLLNSLPRAEDAPDPWMKFSPIAPWTPLIMSWRPQCVVLGQ
ncbi:RNA polymerase sigma factor [Arthrobacter psychrolactophilus]